MLHKPKELTVISVIQLAMREQLKVAGTRWPSRIEARVLEAALCGANCTQRSWQRSHLAQLPFALVQDLPA
jgi:hypothetical protein